TPRRKRTPHTTHCRSLQVVADAGPVAAAIGTKREVLAHGEKGEHLAPFGHMGDALAGYPVRIAAADLAAKEADGALLRIDGAGDGLEYGGLAGAVAAQDGDDAARMDVQADAADGHDRAVVSLDVADAEQRLTHRRRSPD